MRIAAVKVELLLLSREGHSGDLPTDSEVGRAIEEALHDLPFDVSVESGNGSAWRIASAVFTDSSVTHA